MEHDEKYPGRGDYVVRPDKTDHNKRLVISALAIIAAATIVTVELKKNITDDMITY
ncbi:MAG: hypothetical protein K6F55_01830 [Eubacterium sp.]|nr:hypothetical protein [Eubacterium sp.]